MINGMQDDSKKRKVNVKMSYLKVIQTKEEYIKACDILGSLMEENPVSNTPEGDDLALLAVLIDKYEKENFQIPELDPIEVIKYFLDEKGYEKKDVIGIIGDKTLVSRIFNKKRKLTLEMIRGLVEFLSIPIELLVVDYELSN
tara:strand:+ start:31783 stop:32211 length:429 start_codon:yes stop_codon:yes gene_type:complete